jgi:hypothetical protein
MNRNIKENLDGMGQTLGITKGEVAKTLKMRKRQSLSIIPMVAFTFAGGAFFDTLGTHYGGICQQDFKRLPRWLRWLLGLR